MEKKAKCPYCSRIVLVERLDIDDLTSNQMQTLFLAHKMIGQRVKCPYCKWEFNTNDTSFWFESGSHRWPQRP